jgi:hypothetical protein
VVKNVLSNARLDGWLRKVTELCHSLKLRFCHHAYLKEKDYDYLFQSLCPDPAYCVVCSICRTRRRFFCPLLLVLFIGVCLPVDDLQSQAGITNNMKSGSLFWRRIFAKLLHVYPDRFAGFYILEQRPAAFHDKHHF